MIITSITLTEEHKAFFDATYIQVSKYVRDLIEKSEMYESWKRGRRNIQRR